MRRRLFWLSCFLLAALWRALPAQAEPVAIEAVPVLLDPADPSRDRIGQLRFRAGFHLRSRHRLFGGFSGLLIDPKSHRLVAITDNGAVMEALLTQDSAGTLTGLVEADIAPLTDADGDPLTSKRNADAEALARHPEGGLLVAFEHRHRLWRYAHPGAPATGAMPPRELPLAPRNDGIEALALLADGRLFALTEGFRTNFGVVGWIGTGNDWTRFTYETHGRYSPTGATTLPGGDILVVERHYSLVAGTSIHLARLGRGAVERPGLVPGTRMRGQTVAELRAPLTVDNMEAVAAVKGPRGETLVYLLSDDNFDRDDQRTLLMQFELLEDGR